MNNLASVILFKIKKLARTFEDSFMTWDNTLTQYCNEDFIF